MGLPRKWLVRLALTVAVAIAACGAGFAALALLRPPTIATYEDQIAYALRSKNIPYQEISYGEMWPDRVNRQYGEQAGPVSIAIFVVLDDGREASGWMECRRLEHDCTLTMLDLDMRRVPLPEFSRQRTLPWLEWAERAIAGLWN